MPLLKRPKLLKQTPVTPVTVDIQSTKKHTKFQHCIEDSSAEGAVVSVVKRETKLRGEQFVFPANQYAVQLEHER